MYFFYIAVSSICFNYLSSIDILQIISVSRKWIVVWFFLRFSLLDSVICTAKYLGCSSWVFQSITKWDSSHLILEVCNVDVSTRPNSPKSPQQREKDPFRQTLSDIFISFFISSLRWIESNHKSPLFFSLQYSTTSLDESSCQINAILMV